MQICCTCMELYQSLVKTPESIAFIALNASFNPCCPFTLLIPASYNPLCHKKPFCGSVEAFSAYSWRTLFLPPHFFPFMLFVQVIYPSLPSLLSKPNNPHAHRPKLFLRAAVLCIQLPFAGKSQFCHYHYSPKTLIIPQHFVQCLFCWIDDLPEDVNKTISSFFASSDHA